MARQPDILYVRTYIDGNAARKLEPSQKPEKTSIAPSPRHRTKVRVEKRMVFYVDPISLCATLVAGILLIAMVIGVIRFGTVDSQVRKMEGYVSTLQEENAQLRAEYEDGYDLSDIEEQALAMGMVPEDQVEHITVHVEPPQPDPRPTAWQEFCAVIAELFA